MSKVAHFVVCMVYSAFTYSSPVDTFRALEPSPSQPLALSKEVIGPIFANNWSTLGPVREAADPWFLDMGLTKERTLVSRKKQVAAARRLLENPALGVCSIPHILHYIHGDTKHSDRQLYVMNENLARLGDGWNLHIWNVSGKKILGDVLKNPRVLVREVNEDFWLRDIRGRTLYDRFQKTKSVEVLAKILIPNILYNEGGLYLSGTAQIKINPSPLLDYGYSYIGLHDGGVYRTEMMAVVPQSILFDNILKFQDTLYWIKDTYRKKYDPGYWLGSLPLTFWSDFLEHNNLLLLPAMSNPFFTFSDTGEPAPALNRGLLFGDRPWIWSAPVRKWRLGLEVGLGANTIPILKKLFGKDLGYLKKQRQKAVELIEKERDTLNPKPKNVIPKISHQIWLTQNSQIPKTHIRATHHRIKSYGPEWKHILWVINKEVLEASLRQLMGLVPELEVREVDDYYLKQGEASDGAPSKARMWTRAIFDGLYEKGLYALAADTLKRNVLWDGGVYSDLGLKPLCNLSYLVSQADYVFCAKDDGIFDVTFMGFPPKDPVLERTLKYLEEIDSYRFSAHPTFQWGLVGSRLFHACLASELDRKIVLPIISGLQFVNVHFSSTTKRNQQLGNVTLNDVLKTTTIYQMMKERK